MGWTESHCPILQRYSTENTGLIVYLRTDLHRPYALYLGRVDMLHHTYIYTLVKWDISTMSPGFEFEGTGWCKRLDQPDNVPLSTRLQHSPDYLLSLANHSRLVELRLFNTLIAKGGIHNENLTTKKRGINSARFKNPFQSSHAMNNQYPAVVTCC